MLKTCNGVVGTLISDGAWVYRCWVVYNRRWLIIALPMFLWLSYLSLSIYVICVEVQSVHGNLFPLFRASALQFDPMIISGFSVSLFNNFLTHGLIVHRIRQVDKETSLYTTGSRNTRDPIHTFLVKRVKEQGCRMSYWLLSNRGSSTRQLL